MNKKKIVRVLSILVIIAASLYVFRYAIVPLKIEGDSMAPTLYNNDVVFMNGISKNISRGDVVVIDSQLLNEKIVKRVIGLPGDLLEYKDDQLYINKKKVKEDYLDYKHKNGELLTDNFKIQLHDDEYFVLGDNRQNSNDSRSLGVFSKKDIIAREGFIIGPIRHLGVIE